MGVRPLGHLIKIRPRRGTLQLSRGRTSLVTTEDGEIHRDCSMEGLYIYDTRVLSRYAWMVNRNRPRLSCSSNVDQSTSLAYLIQVPESRSGTPSDEGNPLQQTLELRIERSVGEGMHEDVYLTNYTQAAQSAVLDLEFTIDFLARDEVEHGRKQQGELTFQKRQPQARVWELISRYHARHHFEHQGNTGVATLDRGMCLRIENSDSVPDLHIDRVSFQVSLAAHQEWHFCLSWLAYVDGRQLPLWTDCLNVAGNDLEKRKSSFLSRATSFSFPNSNDLTPTVKEVLTRSTLDLEALRLHDLEVEDGNGTIGNGIPLAAGIPTYQEVFGRDMEASSWQAALLSPVFLHGALEVLNRRSATERNDWRDAQPGRVVHEIHTDPVSALNYRPKSMYFGGVSSSLLFPIAVVALWHWTGDLNLIRRYTNTAIRAIEWADKYSLDSTGFYRYQSRSEQGIKNQGWKDSDDAIVYPDGTQVDAPIGTCEMQAFAYAAKLALSEVMFRLGEMTTALSLYRDAEGLRVRFNEKFWMEDEGYFGLAIDPHGDLVRSIAADPGHCLLSGIVDESRVKRVASRMMREDLFSGWGIRTLSAEHPAYNPFSYHRGSVWPVTAAAFVMAFSRYGLHGEMNQLAKAMFEAAALFEHHRLPEVFGGHPRSRSMPFPGLYTSADFPQAWSASSLFLILQAMLGVSPYAPARLLFLDPHLPEWLPEITVGELHVGKAVATIRFWRTKEGTTDYEVKELRGSLHVIRQPSPWSLTSGWAERIDDAISSFLPRHHKT